MNPLHLDGLGINIQVSNRKSGSELMITDGRRNNSISERYLFRPRQCPHDSIIIEGHSGHISLQALRWLSRNNVPVFLLDFDGSLISSILPPIPVKADLRAAQFQAANDPKTKFHIAHALVKAKLTRSLQFLKWLAERYDIEKQVHLAEEEVRSLNKASTVPKIRTVEGRTALRYWQAFKEIMPERLHFQGRMTTSHQNNAVDPINVALNYGYGFLKVECRMAINSVGLEPAVGFLHEPANYQTKESLVYDLEEPFRWLIDLTVIQAFESGKLNPLDFTFTRDDYLYRIETEGRRRFLDLLREQFNSGVSYKGRICKWDTVIEEKTSELARYLIGSRSELDFLEPVPILERTDSKVMRERILSLTSFEARALGITKQTFHDLRKKARDQRSFRVYSKVKNSLN